MQAVFLLAVCKLPVGSVRDDKTEPKRSICFSDSRRESSRRLFGDSGLVAVRRSAANPGAQECEVKLDEISATIDSISSNRTNLHH